MAHLILNIFATLALVVVAKSNLIAVVHHDKTVDPTDPADSSLATKQECGKSANSNRRLAGGTQVDLSDFPWMFALSMYNKTAQFYKKLGCGGTLINRRYILTAAHCLEHLDMKNDEKGDHILGIFHESRVHKAIVHEKYTAEPNVASNYDIALLRLTRRMKYSKKTRPVCLPDANDRLSDGQMLTMLGWGFMNENERAEKLRSVEVPVDGDFYGCKQDLKREAITIEEDKNVCAKIVDGKFICKGDSGGPAMLKNSNNAWVQHGIASIGALKCDVNAIKHMVFVKVAGHLDWIKESIKRMEA